MKNIQLIFISYRFREQSFFTERVFQIFDRDNSGSISMQEFLDAMHQFAGQSPDDKIKFLFKVYDLDGKFFDLIFSYIYLQILPLVIFLELIEAIFIFW